MPMTTTRPRPLVVTADEQLLDDLLRLAAAAGAELDVAHDAGTARGRWSPAPLVLVGDDLVESVIRLAPPRRHEVLLLARDRSDPELYRRAVDLGALQVRFLPEHEAEVVDRLADATEGRGVDPIVVGVVGGCGGAGASTLAAGLSLTGARRELSSLLIDLDVLGGGLDAVLGAESVSGLRWPDLAGSHGRLASSVVREQLPTVHGISLLSWDRGSLADVGAVAARAVLAAGTRSHELLVVDLPRRFDPAAEQALAMVTTVLVVVPAVGRSLAAAARTAQSVAPLAVDVRVVVRHRSRSTLDAEQVAATLGLPLAAGMAAEPRLGERLDAGVPPCFTGRGPLAKACDQLLDRLVFERQVRVA